MKDRGPIFWVANCQVECPPNQYCSCPKSSDLQGNFGLSSLPRLTTIHSSFIIFHNPDARCLPKSREGVAGGIGSTTR